MRGRRIQTRDFEILRNWKGRGDVEKSKDGWDASKSTRNQPWKLMPD